MPGSACATHPAESTRPGAFGGVLDRLIHLELTYSLDLPTRRSRAQTRTGAASEGMTDFQKLAAEFPYNSKPCAQGPPCRASVRAACFVVCLNPQPSKEFESCSDGSPLVGGGVSRAPLGVFSPALQHRRAHVNEPICFGIGDHQAGMCHAR